MTDANFCKHIYPNQKMVGDSGTSPVHCPLDVNLSSVHIRHKLTKQGVRTLCLQLSPCVSLILGLSLLYILFANNLAQFSWSCFKKYAVLELTFTFPCRKSGFYREASGCSCTRTRTSMHPSIAILRHVAASGHVALTLVCWLLHGVFLYEHLEDEVGERLRGVWCAHKQRFLRRVEEVSLQLSLSTSSF